MRRVVVVLMMVGWGEDLSDGRWEDDMDRVVVEVGGGGGLVVEGRREKRGLGRFRRARWREMR